MIFKEVEIDRRVGLVVYNLNGRKLKGVIGGGTNRSSIGSKFWYWCRCKIEIIS